MPPEGLPDLPQPALGLAMPEPPLLLSPPAGVPVLPAAVPPPDIAPPTGPLPPPVAPPLEDAEPPSDEPALPPLVAPPELIVVEPPLFMTVEPPVLGVPPEVIVTEPPLEGIGELPPVVIATEPPLLGAGLLPPVVPPMVPPPESDGEHAKARNEVDATKKATLKFFMRSYLAGHFTTDCRNGARAMVGSVSVTPDTSDHALRAVSRRALVHLSGGAKSSTTPGDDWLYSS